MPENNNIPETSEQLMEKLLKNVPPKFCGLVQTTVMHFLALRRRNPNKAVFLAGTYAVYITILSEDFTDFTGEEVQLFICNVTDAFARLALTTDLKNVPQKTSSNAN